jgi:hypothetical protein
MQIDPEEFRKHYASLSDDALLEINRDELVDVAQQCYDEELTSRGFVFEEDVAAVEAVHDTEPESGEDWVLVGSYLSADEANLAHAMLADAAIPARLAANNTSAWTGIGEIHLMVAPAMLAEAELILGSPISEEELIAQAEAEPSPDGPADEDE